MTEAEVEQEIKEFIIYWARRNVRLPNPDNYPRCFQQYIKLWRYYKERAM